MSRRDGRDEEIDFGEQVMNAENEERLAGLTDSIAQLKTSANYLKNKVESDGKQIDEMQNQMDDLMEFLNSVRQKLKKLFGTTGMGHLLVLVIGGIGILVVIYVVAFKLN
ncbi:hypothetical protein EHI8A_067890 [Entamoeba histolytica HM-1:IMSS-B]|uniref:t-SNARE coiled-coil homology domain-containing protein n=7 Tax=Entamoeba histolytica TaxID=5759 RepID=A0A8U0WPI0_ENTH1|eukprot:XP_653098.1 hypothetical protein EHI_086200 [Entamoeba histolytica HM-1:IMSS]